MLNCELVVCTKTNIRFSLRILVEAVSKLLNKASTPFIGLIAAAIGIANQYKVKFLLQRI